MARGKKEGEIEGKQEGKKEDRIEIAGKMLKRGMSKNLIHEITELPMEEIDQIEQEIKHP